MAILNFCGFESGGVREGNTASGTHSVQSTTVRSGGYALRVNPTGTAVGVFSLQKPRTDGRKDLLLSVNTLYTTFYFRANTLPATEERFYTIFDTGASEKCYLTITSSGLIKAYGTALGGTGSTALSTNTWYCIEVKSSTGSGNQPFQVKIDGTLELDLSINQLTNQNGYARFGKSVDLNGGSVDFYYDDIVLRDDAFHGECSIKPLLVNGDGSTQQWTSGTSPSDYTCIDEVPYSASDYIQSNGSANQVALFNLQSCADAGIAGTIQAMGFYTDVQETSSVTSSNKVRIRSGSTNSDSTAYNHSVTFVTRVRFLETDPATSAAWTTSGVDSVEVGLVEANAVAMRCPGIVGHVLFVPPTGTSAQTLDEATQSASGTVGSSETTGTSAQVADESSQAASGTLTYTGASGQTSDESQQSAAGVITNTGTAAQAIDEASQASAGLVSYEGLSAQTLDETSQGATGELNYTGALGQVSDETAQGAAGELAYTGASVQILDESLQAAAGALTNTGSSAQTSDEASQAAAGEVESADRTGSIAQVGDETSQAASGSLLYTGALAQDLDEGQQSASGALTVEGAVAQTLDGANQAIIGTIANIGTIIQVSDRVSQSLNDVIIYPLVEISLTRAYQTTLDRQYAIELERSFTHAVY